MARRNRTVNGAWAAVDEIVKEAREKCNHVWKKKCYGTKFHWTCIKCGKIDK